MDSARFLNESLSTLYVAVRRIIRSAVIRSSFLDRSLGRFFRKTEARFGWFRKALTTHRQYRERKIEVLGMTLHFRPEDLGVVGSLLTHGDYEPETRKIVEDLIEPGMTFVDLGAHIGFFSILVGRRIAPGGRVFAFEPIAETAEILTRNVAENHLGVVVRIEVMAVSDRSGTLTFTMVPGSSVSNKIRTDYDESSLTRTIVATSLDEYFGALGWPPVHLIKIDVEGAELAVFMGMRQLVERNPSLRCIFELNHPNLERMGISAQALFDTLVDLGFRCFTRLHRVPTRLKIPEDIPATVALAREATFNILAEKAQPVYDALGTLGHPSNG